MPISTTGHANASTAQAARVAESSSLRYGDAVADGEAGLEDCEAGVAVGEVKGGMNSSVKTLEMSVIVWGMAPYWTR